MTNPQADEEKTQQNTDLRRVRNIPDAHWAAMTEWGIGLFKPEPRKISEISTYICYAYFSVFGIMLPCRSQRQPTMSHHGILLHVIFSTQYRKQLLEDVWRSDLFGVIGNLVQEHKASLLQGGGIADHVHLLLRISPAYAIADTIRHLKANSSQWINATHHSSIEFHWQRGYAAFSVSQSLVDVVKNYIVNQAEHHRKRSFKEEYLDLLNRHKIAFNPKYVFEEEIIS